MSGLETIELVGGFVEVEIRQDHLFVVATGQLVQMSELRRYAARLDSIVRRAARSRVLLDARGEVGRPPPEVKEAMWRWLTSDDGAISSLAFVLATDHAVAAMNAIAEERGASVRAFTTVSAASAWLMRDRERERAPTEPRAFERHVAGPPVKAALSANPPTGRRQRLSPGGTYQASDAPADHVRGGGSNVA